ncbi:zinc finger protein 32-like isoform X2 [Colias croceus]|uniref:zinc finger protein 32-like isoform X1 n=1 Tax=Colias crocea TaxID=72248 RepID=UPI001E27E97A|nr:zinc finger protein 32-like isoform X1 [Colias croceus]XP_045505788.1 zinc finger protein 32-like isoform X2 [Colias croceus]
MHPLKCCRLCINSQNLYPIFMYPEHSEKYTNIILIATGIKVEYNDNLPQEICSNCISFLNESNKYRRKCEEIQQFLLNYQPNDTLPTVFTLKFNENVTTIDIFDANDDDFKEFDDNITLDTFQINEHKEMSTDAKPIIEETDNIFDKKKRSAVRKKNVVRTLRGKTDKEDKRKKERGKEEIECEYCHKILTSKLSLRNHYKIHTGFDVVCEHCGKKFITRRLLLMHCRAKHGYEKTDKCSYCDYKASNAEQVKIHERLHTGEKPYVCNECNAGFHRKSSYLQHIAIHLPEKTVQCDQCPARFKSVTLMRIHKNRHRAPQYRYKCGVCDSSFARRRNAARHLQRVHGVAPDHHIHRHNIH